MSILHDSPVVDESTGRQSVPPWPGRGGTAGPDAEGPYGSYGPSGPGGYGGSGGSGGPGGYGWPPSPVRRPRRHRLILTAAAAVVAIAGGMGAFFGVQGNGTTAGNASATANRTLTTSQIAAAVDPGLVDINTTLGYQNGAAAGTGIVLTSSGEILTNNHVVEGATSITATDVGNGQTYKATVVGYDQTDDLAVIQLRGASGLKTAPVGDSSGVAVGQRVVGLGNAGGKGGTPSVAAGNVTATGQSITASDQSASTSEQLTGLIETDAPIQAGDSGGPLVSSAGQVIGMDTAASSGFQFQPSTQNQATQSFAIPINKALSIANQIKAGSSSSTVHVGATGFLGVELATSSSAAPGPGGNDGGNGFAGNGVGNGSGAGGGVSSGAVVAGVVPGTPAAQLGLTGGDTIVSLGGQAVGSPSDIQKVMNGYHPGDKVSVTWIDQFGQSQSGTLTLANGPVG